MFNLANYTGVYIFIIYIFSINIYTFFLMGYDKKKARKRDERVAEKRFFLWAVAGGAAGVYLGMIVFRHKTRHSSFSYGIPLIFVGNIAILLIAFFVLCIQ